MAEHNPYIENSGLRRLSCDTCGALTEWEFLPPHVYPKPDGWVLTKNNQMCGRCFMASKFNGRDKMHDLYERVLEKRNYE